jgi:hypothetical protein
MNTQHRPGICFARATNVEADGLRSAPDDMAISDRIVVERLLTVVETCRRQQRNVFSWLVDAVETRFAGRTAPSLSTGV